MAKSMEKKIEKFKEVSKLLKEAENIVEFLRKEKNELIMELPLDIQDSTNLA